MLGEAGLAAVAWLKQQHRSSTVAEHAAAAGKVRIEGGAPPGGRCWRQLPCSEDTGACKMWGSYWMGH